VGGGQDLRVQVPGDHGVQQWGLHEEELATQGFKRFHGAGCGDCSVAQVAAAPAGIRGWARFERWAQDRRGEALAVVESRREQEAIVERDRVSVASWLGTIKSAVAGEQQALEHHKEAG
jgi:hypothetical protein